MREFIEISEFNNEFEEEITRLKQRVNNINLVEQSLNEIQNSLPSTYKAALFSVSKLMNEAAANNNLDVLLELREIANDLRRRRSEVFELKKSA